MSVSTFKQLVASNDLQFSDGYRTKRSELAGEGFLIVRAADLNESLIGQGSDFVASQYGPAIGEKVVKHGDIALTTKGTVGRVTEVQQVNEPMVYSPQICYFRTAPHGSLRSCFLRYWFNSPQFWRQCSHLMSNTDMAPYLSLRDIASLEITLPTVGEQIAIAAVLGALDDKIATNTTLASVANELAISHCATPVTKCLLSEVAQFDRTTINPTLIETAFVYHYSLPAFDAGKLPAMDVPSDIKSNKFLLKAPRVLVSKLNPRIPRVWAVDQATGLPGVASTEFLPLFPREISYQVLWSAVSCASFGRRLEAQVAGTSGSHQRVRPDDLMATEINDPRLLPTATTELINSLVSTSIQARCENMTLAALRDTLLPALMSGRLKVKDAERQVEDAV